LFHVTAFVNMEMMGKFDLPSGVLGRCDWKIHVYDNSTGSLSLLAEKGRKRAPHANLLISKLVWLPTQTPRFELHLREMNRLFSDDVFKINTFRFDPGTAEMVSMVSAPASAATHSPRSQGRQELLHMTTAFRSLGETRYQLLESSLREGIVRKEDEADRRFLPEPFDRRLDGVRDIAPLLRDREDAQSVLYLFRVERL
jgi:hypothetical protein